MSGPVDLPKVLPLFPLPGVLLLPRARLPLNIFEPRYLQMFDDALKSEGRLIGMIQPRLGVEEEGPEGPPPPLHSIGCAGRITAFSETEDGRYLVTLTGVSRFRLLAELPGFSPYRRAEVDFAAFAADLGAAEAGESFDRRGFIALLRRYFKAMQLSTDWESLKEAPPELLINALAMLCPFEAADKQALLEAPGLADRHEALRVLMEFALMGKEGEGRLQ